MNKATELTGKVKGKIKAAGAAMRGEAGILNRLIEEHKVVSTLIESACKTEDTKKRTDLLAKIKAELLSHAKGEESELYPVLAEIPKLSHRMPEARREHKEMEECLKQLDQRDATVPVLNALFADLKEIVEHHVDDEENEIFPIASEEISKDRLHEIEDRYLNVKEAEKERLSRSLS